MIGRRFNCSATTHFLVLKTVNMYSLLWFMHLKEPSPSEGSDSFFSCRNLDSTSSFSRIVDGLGTQIFSLMGVIPMTNMLNLKVEIRNR